MAPSTLDLAALCALDEGVMAPVAPVREGRVVIDPRRGLRAERAPLARFARGLCGEAPAGYVAASEHDLVAALRDQLPVPELVRGATWRVTKLWVGAAGTVSALHRDLAHNAHSVLEGRKRFWLASPRHDRDLYPCAPWDPIPNGSRVDPERPDLSKFSRFSRVRPLVISLDAGDTLLLPSRWWHHVRTEAPTVAVNTFFAWGALAAAVAAANALKGAMGLNR